MQRKITLQGENWEGGTTEKVVKITPNVPGKGMTRRRFIETRVPRTEGGGRNVRFQCGEMKGEKVEARTALRYELSRMFSGLKFKWMASNIKKPRA